MVKQKRCIRLFFSFFLCLALLAGCFGEPAYSDPLFNFPKEGLVSVTVSSSYKLPEEFVGEDAERALDIINSFVPANSKEKSIVSGGVPIGSSFIKVKYDSEAYMFEYSWHYGYEWVNCNDTFYYGEDGCFEELKEMVDNVPLRIIPTPTPSVAK